MICPIASLNLKQTLDAWRVACVSDSVGFPCVRVAGRGGPGLPVIFKNLELLYFFIFFILF